MFKQNIPNMKNLFICTLIMLGAMSSFAQNEILYVYDLVNQTLDSIPTISNSDATVSDQTNHYIGNFNTNIADLPQSPPTDNLFPNSLFTLKETVTNDFEITDFPIRTSVKIYYREDGELLQFCSGSIVSSQHVLTAAHCIYDFWESMPRGDTFWVCPIFHEGEFSTDFDCTPITKVFSPKNWEGGKDIALLEMAQPLGTETGWLGIGFHQQDDFFTQGIYHKFSYPMQHIPVIDPIMYDGDTLYHQYGKVDDMGENFLGIKNARGISGESGSSLSLVENNNDTYTSYGVLVWSSNLRHTRIKDWMFYTFQNVMLGALTPNPKIPQVKPILFPNPTVSSFSIKGIEAAEVQHLQIIDQLGRVVKYITSPTELTNIFLTDVATGVYYVELKMEEMVFRYKLVKVKE